MLLNITFDMISIHLTYVKGGINIIKISKEILQNSDLNLLVCIYFKLYSKQTFFYLNMNFRTRKELFVNVFLIVCLSIIIRLPQISVTI